MYRLYSTVKERMSRYLMATANLTADAHIGDKFIVVDNNVTDFSFEAMNDKFPEIQLSDDDATGERIADGFNGCKIIDIILADINTKIITLVQPLTRNWLVSKHAMIQRAPGGVPVKQVKIGDFKVVSDFPAVCISPVSKSQDWTALQITKETMTIDFLAYVARGDTEQGSIDILKLCDAVEWILWSNLHLKLEGEIEQFNVTSMAMVKNTDYGTVSKGSAILKAAKISWEGEVHFARDYFFGRLPYERKTDSL